jgi:hypothetical protein
MSENMKGTSDKEEKKGKVKVGTLQRNSEAVTDLSASEQKQIKGGMDPLRQLSALPHLQVQEAVNLKK